VLLFGTEYWGGLLDWIRSTLIESATISADDVELFRLTDDVSEVIKTIQEAEAARQQEGSPGGGMRSLPPTGPLDA
jgi:predicted Rossmann-fold nucleotide-binding protein